MAAVIKRSLWFGLVLISRPVLGVFEDVKTEAAALALLGSDQEAVQKCDPSEAGLLVTRGWWNAAREFVKASHRALDGKQQAAVETVVRREVGQLKQRSEELLLALSPSASERIGSVRCAFQWAQNSSAIFLSIKFAHRWTSPGALSVHDEAVAVSDCCFNFSASGSHSQLRKRYELDLHLFRPVNASRWSWQYASAGRMTVEIQKSQPGRWDRLLYGSDRPGSMGSWESMQARWDQELRDFERARRAEQKAAGKAAKEDATLMAEAAYDSKVENLAKTCLDSKDSPFSRDSAVERLCDSYWPPRMQGKKGREMLWLVLFHSPSKMGCADPSPDCVKARDAWTAVGRKVPELTKAKVGAIDCDANLKLCQKQEVDLEKLPLVLRYRGGTRKAHHGPWDVDAIMKFVLS